MQQPLDNSAKEYKELAKEAVRNMFKVNILYNFFTKFCKLNK